MKNKNKAARTVPAALRLKLIQDAIHDLKFARENLRLAGAPNSHAAVCRALKSTRGAERNAYNRVGPWPQLP